MNPRGRAGFVASLAVSFSASCLAQAPAANQQTRPTGSELAPRPVASVPKPVANETEGRIRLDVVVADAAGKPTGGLTRQDFRILDNDRPLAISSFQGVEGTAEQDQPITVILVIDLVNAAAADVTAARTQLSKYLRQNDGKLANPVLIVVFAPDGLQIQSQPSIDGNSLASFVDQLKPGPPAAAEQGDQFSQSLEALTATVDVALKESGRKLLFWTGKGWPVPKADDPNMSMGQNDANIGALVALTNRLREARIVIYGGDPAFRRDVNEGMTNLQKLDPATLSLGALAQRTGGHGLARADVGSEINRAIAASSPHYTLSFTPPASDKPDEYHAVKLVLGQPKLTAHAMAGYYSEPPAQ